MTFEAASLKMGLVHLPVELLEFIIDDLIPQNWGYHSPWQSVLNLRRVCKLFDHITLRLAFRKIDVNSINRKGVTALSWAAGVGQAAVVRLLLGRKLDTIDAIDFCGRTALDRAAENGHEVVVRLLLEKGAIKYGLMPLPLAAKNGHKAVVEALLEKKADMDPKHSRYCGRTSLLWAAEYGTEEIVKLLLESGASVDFRDENGGRPLSLAARNGHEAVVKLLLKNGADVNVRDNYDRTPLSLAAEKGHEAVVELLLREKGIDLDSKGGYCCRTPLLWAAAYGRQPVVKLLLGSGANVDVKDRYGLTFHFYQNKFARNGRYSSIDLVNFKV